MLRLSVHMWKQTGSLQRLTGSARQSPRSSLLIIARKMTQQQPQKFEWTTSIPTNAKDKDKITALGWFLLVSCARIDYIILRDLLLSAHTRHNIWLGLLASQT